MAAVCIHGYLLLSVSVQFTQAPVAASGREMKAPWNQDTNKDTNRTKKKKTGQRSNAQPWQTASRPIFTSCQELFRFRFICPPTHTCTHPPSEWCSRWFVSSLASLESMQCLKVEPLCLHRCNLPTCPVCEGLLKLLSALHGSVCVSAKGCLGFVTKLENGNSFSRIKKVKRSLHLRVTLFKVLLLVVLNSFIS